LRRNDKNSYARDRIKAILLADKGWTYRKIAKVLLIDERTISRHVHGYREEENFVRSRVVPIRSMIKNTPMGKTFFPSEFKTLKNCVYK
jgi:hypothetical protein